MERKYLAIAGFVLVAVIVVAGIVFSPSGFVPAAQGGTFNLACMELDSSTDFCEGPESFWSEAEFHSKRICETARDGDGKSCLVLGCTCRYLKE